MHIALHVDDTFHNNSIISHSCHIENRHVDCDIPKERLLCLVNRDSDVHY
jgi:hypothetical protein